MPKRNQKGPKGISGHRAVLYDDAMFVIFGRKRENELSNEMWKYSFESHAWSCEKQQGQLPPNLTGAAVEVVGKRLFVVGGKTEDASFNKSLYLFSFAKRRWYKYGVDSEHTALSEATLIRLVLLSLMCLLILAFFSLYRILTLFQYILYSEIPKSETRYIFVVSVL